MTVFKLGMDPETGRVTLFVLIGPLLLPVMEMTWSMFCEMEEAFTEYRKCNEKLVKAKTGGMDGIPKGILKAFSVEEGKAEE